MYAFPISHSQVAKRTNGSLRKTGTRAQHKSVAPRWGGECEALRRPRLRHLLTNCRRSQSEERSHECLGKANSLLFVSDPAVQKESRSAFIHVQIKTRALVDDSVGIGGSTSRVCHARKTSCWSCCPSKAVRCAGTTMVWSGHDAAPLRGRNESWQRAAAFSSV